VTLRGTAVRGTVIGALALALLTGCARDPQERAAPQASADRGQPFSLYTHCGIDELRFEGSFYQRSGGLLDDGSGNPPAGWGNPSQAGWLSSAGGGIVVFTDRQGHREQFELRPGATAFKRICS
jgi:hypothetical protein